MTPNLRKSLPRGWVQPLALALGRLGLTPNTLTVLGLLLSAIGAVVLALGHLLMGGVLVLVSGLFDLMDGTLARATQRTSAFGAVLDSTFDRYGEALSLLGLLFYYLANGGTTEIVLIYVAIVGSLMVSYVKARAEGVGLSCDVGIFTRSERVFVLAVSLIIGQVLIGLWLLAVLANVTAVHRLLEVKKQAERRR